MIANKYQIVKPLGRGKFGQVFEGIRVSKVSEEKVAIKLETSAIQTLKNESTLLHYLYSEGCRKIPVIYWFGKYEEYPALVMSHYTESLEQVFRRLNTSLCPRRIHGWIKQMIDILESVHGSFVIHRDIKPQNFMFKTGVTDDDVGEADLYLIDFGLASIYVDDKKHPLPLRKKNNHLLGTPKFVSYYVHEGWDPGRRDDYISVAYIWMYLLYGTLPWENLGVQESDPSHNDAENSGPMWIDETSLLHEKNQLRKERKTLEYLTQFLGQRPREGSDALYKLIQQAYQIKEREAPFPPS